MVAGQGDEVDTHLLVANGEAGTFMDEPVPIQAFGEAGLAQQGHRAGFEDAGADAGFDVGAALAFEHDAVDAFEMQQVR